MTTKVLRLVGAVTASLAVAEVLLIWCFLAEACDDGLNPRDSERFVPLGELLLAVAPFSLFPFVSPILIGVLHWRSTRKIAVGIPALIQSVSFATLGLIALAVCTEFTKESIFMDGGRGGSAAAWLFNGSLNVGLFWMILRLWNGEAPGSTGEAEGGRRR